MAFIVPRAGWTRFNQFVSTINATIEVESGRNSKAKWESFTNPIFDVKILFSVQPLCSLEMLGPFHTTKLKCNLPSWSHQKAMLPQKWLPQLPSFILSVLCLIIKWHSSNFACYKQKDWLISLVLLPSPTSGKALHES